MSEEPSIPLSSSVQNASNRLAGRGRIGSWAMVSEILHEHPEYAGRMGGKIRGESGPPQGEQRTRDEWLEGLYALFDINKLPPGAEVIDGRLAIWGLAHLDPQLKAYLDSFGFLQELAEEYKREKHLPPGALLRQPTPTEQKGPEPALPTELVAALRSAIATPDPGAQAAALAKLVADTPEGARKHLIAAVEEIPGERQRADLLAGLGQSLALLDPTLQSQLLHMARTLPDPHLRAISLAALARALSPMQRAALLAEARDTATSISDAAIREAVLGDLNGGYSPPVAGYVSDRVSDAAPDRLDVESEVATIANVLTFKPVQPPLALGLFGDWGSGKTFFMGKLRQHIGQIADHYRTEEQRTGQEAVWCSRVAQIDFNAWHFSDANLWASLVTRIYEGLDRELSGEKGTADELKKKIIEAQLAEAKERALKAASQLDQVQARVSEANEKLKQKKKDREEQENSVQRLIGTIPALLEDPAARKPLERAANALGVPEAAQTYQALEELDGQLSTLSGRLTSLTMSLLHSPWSLILMALLILALPVGIAVAVETWGAKLGAIGQGVTKISAFLLCVIGWLQAQARRGLGLVKDVESALQKAREVRQEKIENDGSVIEAREKLAKAQVEEGAARANLETAQAELQRLQDELQELRPERRLQRLIEERASTGAYSQHLGIISLIRADFENMSRLLVQMVEAERDYKSDPAPIQRIILYIDDLDRCRPERVVEVLEAVHLLLFFPLFVVVVAVDPRWLRHSLTQHYPATLTEGSRVVMLDGHAGLSLYSTPQDYLEKIFQIPFALRPVEKSGYQNLVDDLLKPLPSKERRAKAPPREKSLAGAGGAGGTQASESLNGERQPSGGGGMSPTGQKKEQDTGSAETPFTPIPPRQLQFTEWEKTDLQRLWPMFRAPRTVKRFVNIYRLVRAGLPSAEEVAVFEGTKDCPGHYQTALLLLAAVTAFPNEAARFLCRLDDWLDQQPADSGKTWRWQEVIEFLEAKESEATGGADGTDANNTRPHTVRDEATQNAHAPAVEERGSAAKAARTRSSNDGQAAEAGTANTPWDETHEEESSWELLVNCIKSVTDERTWAPFQIDTLRTWAARVARFSFSVHPAQVLHRLGTVGHSGGAR